MQIQRLVLALLLAPLMETVGLLPALAQPTPGALTPNANDERRLFSPPETPPSDLETPEVSSDEGLEEDTPELSPEEQLFPDRPAPQAPQEEVTNLCINDPNDSVTFPAPTPVNGHSPGEGFVYSSESLIALLDEVLQKSRGTDLNTTAIAPEITLRQLCDWAKAITLKYVNDGYLTSQAIVLSSAPRELQIYEGLLAEEDINITGLKHLRDGYVRDRILQGIGTPLRVQDLEDQLKLLRQDPLFASFRASLSPKTPRSISESKLVVTLEESDAIDGTLSYDNESPETLGSNRFETEFLIRNMSGIGDTIGTRWQQTGEQGSRLHQFSYEAPFNAKGGTVRLEANVGRSRIVNGILSDLEIKDNSGQYEVRVRQPLWRSFSDEFALSFGYSYRQSQTTVLGQGTPFGAGPEADGQTNVSVVRFSQDYLRRDSQGAWVMQSQFNWGNDWFGATVNDNSVPDSQFLSWLGQVARYQRLGSRHLLIGRMDVQVTADPLLNDEQFVIGGGSSVRGYRQNARLGDNGIRLSFEDRITLLRDQGGSPAIQLIPFLDMGYVWNHADNPNILPADRWLSSVGLGGLWRPVPDFTIRIDYGIPLNPIADNGNDVLQKRGLNFNLDYEF